VELVLGQRALIVLSICGFAEPTLRRDSANVWKTFGSIG
jgi:hypothetical protein